MDEVLATTLQANLKHANSVQEKIDALVLADIAMVDCQRKTSERVKMLCAERQTLKDKFSGGKLVVWGIIGLANSGMLVLAIKFCKVVGILW